MTITLPDAHRRWLEEIAARSGSTVEGVIAQLIEEAWEADEVEVRKSFDEPHRFDHEKLLPGTHWEFTKWTRKDVLGFFGCWAIVGFILLVLWAVLHVGA